MKDHYLINQIAKLYGIGTDSLRYYERLGIIKPKRTDSGYRVYSLNSLHQLNVIRDLRRLQFTMAQIKDYLEEQSIDSTIDLLENEQEILAKEMNELQRIQQSIDHRLKTIDTYSDVEEGRIETIRLPKRHALQLSAEIKRDEDVDFHVKRLHQRHESKLYELGNLTFGAVLSLPDYEAKRYNVFQSVFILVEEDITSDFELPEGEYLRLFYRGAYQQSTKLFDTLYAYCEEHQLLPIGPPIELYHVDNRFTAKVDEFVTEIQLPIRRHRKFNHFR